MQNHLIINKLSIQNIYVAPIQENKILNNSKYTKLLYSTDIITLNGLFFHIQLPKYRYYKHFNKYYISFDNIPSTLYNVMALEKAVLHKHFPTKLPTYNIFNMVQHKQLNYYSSTPIANPGSLILKISGIWSNETECGLTFRIYPSVITK